MTNTHLIKPIITEKTMRLAKLNQFTFAVTQDATRDSVKIAVEQLFKVEVTRVNLLSLVGKTRRSGKKRLISRSSRRFKAVVTLKPGQTIEYFQSDKKKDKKGKKTK